MAEAAMAGTPPWVRVYPRAPCTNGWKIVSSWSGAIPIPVSATVIQVHDELTAASDEAAKGSRSCSAQPSVTTPPVSGLNRIALATRLLIARLSSRDDRAINRDSINLTLDTSGEGRYGFWFGVNLGDTLNDGKDNGFAIFAPSGFTIMGPRGFWPNFNDLKTFMLADSLSIIRGSHTIKFGGETRRNEIFREAQRHLRALVDAGLHVDVVQAAPRGATVRRHGVCYRFTPGGPGRLADAVASFDPLPFDSEAAARYGTLVSLTIAARRDPRPRRLDLMIAAIASVAGLPLFTRNADDFKGLDTALTIVAV